LSKVAEVARASSVSVWGEQLGDEVIASVSGYVFQPNFSSWRDERAGSGAVVTVREGYFID